MKIKIDKKAKEEILGTVLGLICVIHVKMHMFYGEK